MKLTIKLNLPEEQHKFENIVNADKMANLLFEIKHNLSKKARNEFEYRKEQVTLSGCYDELDVFFSLIEGDLKEFSNI